MTTFMHALGRVIYTVTLALVPTVGLASPPQSQKITVNYAATTGPTWPLYVAKAAGYYEKYGLDVNLVYGIHPAGIAMLVSEQAVMANYGLDQAMQAGFRDGSLVVYSSPFKKGLLQLMAAKDIGSIYDLKGKRIGVRQIGDVPYSATVALLAKAGLTPRDVHWLAVGLGGDALGAAIVGRRVDAALVSAPSYFKLEDRKSTRLNSSHLGISYAVFCLKKKKNKIKRSQNRKKIKNKINKKNSVKKKRIKITKKIQP